MPVDADTREQVERVISASFQALNLIAANLSQRDLGYHVLPPSMFLPFAATSQLLKQTPQEQLAWINSAMKLAEDVIAKRSEASRYGKGRNCAPVTKEMAQKAIDLAWEEIEKTNLVVERSAARNKLLLKNLFEYCVMMKILEPKDLSAMMSQAN